MVFLPFARPIFARFFAIDLPLRVEIDRIGGELAGSHFFGKVPDKVPDGLQGIVNPRKAGVNGVRTPSSTG